MKATVITAPTNLTAAQKKARPSLYLAGPFDDGDGTAQQQRSWRDDVIDAVADLDIAVYDPRSARWRDARAAGPASGSLHGAYGWQLHNAFDASVVVVWIPEGRTAATALMILGALAAKRGGPNKGSSVVVGGGGHAGLHQIFATRMRVFPMGNDLGEVIRVARLQLAKALGVTLVAPADDDADDADDDDHTDDADAAAAGIDVAAAARTAASLVPARAKAARAATTATTTTTTKQQQQTKQTKQTKTKTTKKKKQAQ